MKYSDLTIEEAIAIYLRHDAQVQCDGDMQVAYFEFEF